MFEQFQPNLTSNWATLQQQQQQQDRYRSQMTNADHSGTNRQANMMNNNDASHKQHQAIDVSSLLHHHYYQINVPNDDQNNNLLTRDNFTTVLNPSDLFHPQHQQQPPSTHPTNTLYSLSNHQLMLDTILRQHQPTTDDAPRKWRLQVQQKVQNFALNYAAILLRYSILFILIALSILSIIKHTSTCGPTPPITSIDSHTLDQSDWSVREPIPSKEMRFFPENPEPIPEKFRPHDDQDQNAVVWSEWSQWSSCVDKNRLCDPTRLHSRVRNCVLQHTGEKVDASECKRRFGMLDQELEVADCTAACGNSNMGPSILADQPNPLAPFTVPPAFLMPGLSLSRPSSTQRIIGLFDPSDSSDTYQGPSPVSSPSTMVPTQGTISSKGQESAGPLASVTNQPTTGAIHLAEGQQMSCSNCTSDHICLLQLNDKVPFCAKVKDRLDESGCGGWCKAGDQICVPAGQNAFKCTHNSECLPNEWRCHDSACIPASKRCDGHENCFDSSDEQYCSEKSS